MRAASTSPAGTEMECCREGIRTVFTTVDVAALVVERDGIVTVRKAGGAAVEAMAAAEAETVGPVSSQEGTLGKRSSISSFTLQSSSLVPPAAAAAATAPATASTVGSEGGGRTGCCCESRRCGTEAATEEEEEGCAVSACIAPAGLICSAGGKWRMGSPAPAMELCCSILMSEFTRTSEASGEDVVGILASS